MALPCDAWLKSKPRPDIIVAGVPPQEWQGDLLAALVTEEDVSSASTLAELDSVLDGAVADAITSGFKGKQGQQSPVMRLSRGCAARYLVLLGLGKRAALEAKSEWGACIYRAMGGLAAAAAKTVRAKSMAVYAESCEPSSAASTKHCYHWWRNVAVGALSGLWEAQRFKSSCNEGPCLQTMHLLLSQTMLENVDPAALKEVEAAASSESKGVHVAKSMTEAPANICTPTHMAQVAGGLAQLAPDVFSIKTLGRQDVSELGMGLYLGVAQGSDTPLQFIHLTYTPIGGANRKVALVGKGLTFDSGGYNLKTLGGIELMKIDMAGAAAVVGCATALMDLRPPGVEVHFIIAACENMINGKALRPSDILQSASGKYVEVNDTDAEGRLTLADALWYAQEQCSGVTSILDIATLTGACGVALGTRMGGLFASSDAAADAVMAAGKAAGERFWRLPLEEGGYRDMLDSASADLKNYAGGRSAGATTAALFLKEFIRDGVEWAHLDVAGPVWDDKAGLPTGFGVSTLVHWVLAHADAQLAQ